MEGYALLDFHCDAGSLVDEGNLPGWWFPLGACDRPNVLNGVCDEGSRFQMIPTGKPDIYVAAHCRKKGNAAGFYGDVAVIEYNTKTGATCFYQSELTSPIPELNIAAPGQTGSRQRWRRSGIVGYPISCRKSNGCGSSSTGKLLSRIDHLTRRNRGLGAGSGSGRAPAAYRDS